jgi:hypothetical protein
MNGVLIELSSPIKAHGEELLEITLRDPVTKDQMELGMPFLILQGDGDTAIQIQSKTVGKYIVRLAGIPLSSVEQLAFADFGKCQAAVLGFFGAGEDGQATS